MGALRPFDFLALSESPSFDLCRQAALDPPRLDDAVVQSSDCTVPYDRFVRICSSIYLVAGSSTPPLLFPFDRRQVTRPRAQIGGGLIRLLCGLCALLRNSLAREWGATGRMMSRLVAARHAGRWFRLAAWGIRLCDRAATLGALPSLRPPSRVPTPVSSRTSRRRAACLVCVRARRGADRPSSVSAHWHSGSMVSAAADVAFNPRCRLLIINILHVFSLLRATERVPSNTTSTSNARAQR